MSKKNGSNSDFTSAFREIFNIFVERRNFDTNALGGIHEKYWIESGDKKFLFKFNGTEKDYSDFGEVLTSYICSILNINCVKSMFSYDLFSDKEKRGVIVLDYRDKNTEEVISLKALCEKYMGGYGSVDISVKKAEQLVKFYADDANLEIDKNLFSELKIMALIDYLLLQEDRHKNNIEFLIENIDGRKIIKIAPMFDNAFCLFLNRKPFQVKRIMENYRDNIGLENNFSNPFPRLYIGKSNVGNEDINFFVNELAVELIKNKRLMKLYKNFCALDLNKVLNTVGKFCDRPLPIERKELALTGVNYRIKLLNLELLKLQSKRGEENEIVL